MSVEQQSQARYLAYKAAHRLNTVAIVLTIVVSVAAFAGLFVGIVVIGNDAHTAHSSSVPAGVLIMAGSVVGWLFSLLPYLACQAVARYILYRVDET